MVNSHPHLHRRAVAQDGSSDGVANLLNGSDTFHTLRRKQNAARSTIYKTVYTTLKPTFEGAIGGYSTGSNDDDKTTTARAATTTEDAATKETTTRKAQATKETTTSEAAATTKATTKANSKTDTSLPESIVLSTTGTVNDNSLVIATNDPTTPATTATMAATTQAVTGTNAASSSTSTSLSSGSSGGSGSGAKAGIAIGILAGLLVVGMLVFFLFNRRKKQMEKQRIADDEKVQGPFGGADSNFVVTESKRPDSVHTTRTTATAPRLSLRPVTQFLPNFGERRSSKGAAIALAVTTPTHKHTPNSRPVDGSLRENSMTSQSNNEENPFGSGAQRIESQQNVQRSVGNDESINPFNAPENIVGFATSTNSPPESSNIAEVAIAEVGAGAVAGAAVAATPMKRKQSIRKDAPQALDLTRGATLPTIHAQPSPTGTEYSFTSVATGQSPGPSQSANAIAAAGGPASSTVHRVQLDFKPTLEDEMGLRAGQLVRLLHEYDDGWALCIRLDRSQQGVVPRTCLSTRPVKPRPTGGPPGARNGPPRNPNGPRGPRGGPKYPAAQRPMTPQGGPTRPRPDSPIRPMTAGARPQSPAVMPRPQSPAGVPLPQSPAGMPRGQSPGPMSPNAGRNASPAPRSMIPVSRTQSPGPTERGFSQSRPSPSGPSPMYPAPAPGSNIPVKQYQGPPRGPVGRKPVPGQAY
ncbi:uncharacterized protein BCR38DRAFT_457142 [Pseudomassariella vexata]|uniref:SH3 domain-containing protein n=1 Tax=Pseudomassariella vexata TaxID=1141098 RepID=A0A1Y2DZW4_9PEZI|nr:uncharacterized protein BCR38DRAFT_457142 [Pseudomassariella vexata]ORY64821.1 hypothetical protein BCR38DRAFT_457142 [Pseudomassariella vexata]